MAEFTGALVAALDLDALDKRWAADDVQQLDPRVGRALIAEVKRQRTEAAADLRFAVERIEEVTNLRRRLELLRAGMRGIAEIRCLTELEEMAKAVGDELAADTARMKRFHKRLRERSRKRREVTGG